jgi:hypothetical protein
MKYTMGDSDSVIHVYEVFKTKEMIIQKLRIEFDKKEITRHLLILVDQHDSQEDERGKKKKRRKKTHQISTITPSTCIRPPARVRCAFPTQS